jgi:hypothetical protein
MPLTAVRLYPVEDRMEHLATQIIETMNNHPDLGIILVALAALVVAGMAVYGMIAAIKNQ